MKRKACGCVPQMQLRNWAPDLNFSLSALEGAHELRLLCLAARATVYFHRADGPQPPTATPRPTWVPTRFPCHVLVTPAAGPPDVVEGLDLDVRTCCVDTIRFANDDAWFTSLATACDMDAWWEGLWPESPAAPAPTVKLFP
jgi:hypothetical protein